MKPDDELDISPEGEELIKIICGYLSEALEDVLQETEYLEEEETMQVLSKHISKKLDYLEKEGWTDGH